MKKLLLIVAAMAVFAVPANADWVVKVDDPTPNKQFTGTYNKGDTNGDGVEETGTQTGYVGVNDGGYIAACNGNPGIARPDDGSPLVGYIWVGPAGAASNPTAASPGNVIGAGNNHEDADGNPTGASPCP